MTDARPLATRVQTRLDAGDLAGARELCRQLVRLKVKLVAIERPDGLLIELLLDAGLWVPARSRYRPTSRAQAAS